MKTATYMVALATAIFGAAALAETEKRVEVRIASDDEQVTEVRLSGAEMDFDLQEMQIGESRSVVDQSGRTVLITRKEDGYEFDVDGKKVDVPLLDGDYAHWVAGDELHVQDHDTDLHKIVTDDSSDEILIISGAALDSSTQESIRAVLASAGHESEVRFIDGGHGDGERHVKVIRKRVVR